MATFSLGTSGATPGAPGVYINEQPGKAANADLASFSTVYMLVEAEEGVPTTVFPFNKPIPVTSLNDYKVLTAIGTKTVPESRIPLLSYNCVSEFFQNAQVGDLRVVRVGTPDQIVEIEFFPSGSKVNSTGLPSALMAGNKVYVQMTINGQKLVAGDGSTGYTEDGEWLGVPVEIPVNYVAGDEANNRKISAAISTAVAAAIESNPAIRSSVYVRESGLVNDKDPASNSQNSFITIAASTFDGNVSVVTQVLPVGSNFVFMQNTYDINNILGQQGQVVRVPQDYTQCIATAFEGQQSQGYLVTPTAYAQFDAAGRAQVGAAAALHCENNNYKWMALADPGPYLITDVNKYSEFTPHKAAADLVEGLQYLVDNAIYKWTGNDVTYPRLTNQTIEFGTSAQTAITESTNAVAADDKVGLLDSGKYVGTSAVATANLGQFQLNTSNYWPVGLPIQKVTLSGADATTNDLYAYNGTEVYVVAPPYTPNTTNDYPLNWVYLATTAAAAQSILQQVTSAGGTAAIGVAPAGAITVAAPTGSTFTLSYVDPYWDLPVTINGQTSDLIQNTSGSPVGVNTLHLPGTLQDPTETLRLGFVSRTMFNPSVGLTGGITPAGGVGPIATTAALVGGSSYTPGTYAGVVLLGGAGTGAVATIIVDAAGQVTSVAVTTAGSGYYVGDILTAPNASIGGTGSGFSVQVASVSGVISNKFTGAVSFNVTSHGLTNGQKIFFTTPITAGSSTLIKATTKNTYNPYWVTVISTNEFAVSKTLTDYGAEQYVKYVNAPVSSLPTLFYSDLIGGGVTAINLVELDTLPVIRARKYAFNASYIFDAAVNSGVAPGSSITADPGVSIWLNNSAVVLGENQISPYGEDYNTAAWLPKLELSAPTVTPVSIVNNAYCVPTVDQNFQAEAFMVPSIDPIAAAAGTGNYDPTATGTDGPLQLGTGSVGVITGGAGYTNGTYQNVQLRAVAPSIGEGAVATIVVAGNSVTSVTITNGGWGFAAGDSVTAPDSILGPGSGSFSFLAAAPVVATSGSVIAAGTSYANAAGVGNGNSADSLQAALEAGAITGLYWDCSVGGLAPDNTTAVAVGSRMVAAAKGDGTYFWLVIAPVASGGDLTQAGVVCYGSNVKMSFAPEETPQKTLWRFDAITSTEIIDDALRGVNNGGVPEAEFVDAGVDNVNRLYDDSQRYSNPVGFIAYYGPYIKNGAGQFIPPSPYVTGVAVRRYRSEGYQFPPAGVKYVLADAVAAQIQINSAQQNLLNPAGCNAVRTLPGYPQTSVYIWGGRTRVNTKDAQQRLYQFVNTRVILNVVYGSLRSAFDNQIFNVIDGFGVIFNQIISVGNSVLNQLYVRGALFGARPSDAFQVICDGRINPPEDIENGIVNAKIFVTPVPTLERIQIDLVRVAIGKMQQELDIQGLGSTNQ
jgi:hypothetical protein